MQDSKLDGSVSADCGDLFVVCDRLSILPHFIDDVFETIGKVLRIMLLVFGHITAIISADPLHEEP